MIPKVKERVCLWSGETPNLHRVMSDLLTEMLVAHRASLDNMLSVNAMYSPYRVSCREPVFQNLDSVSAALLYGLGWSPRLDSAEFTLDVKRVTVFGMDCRAPNIIASAALDALRRAVKSARIEYSAAHNQPIHIQVFTRSGECMSNMKLASIPLDSDSALQAMSKREDRAMLLSIGVEGVAGVVAKFLGTYMAATGYGASQLQSVANQMLERRLTRDLGSGGAHAKSALLANQRLAESLLTF